MRAREKPDRQVSRGCEMETDNEGQRREQEIKVVSELHGGEKKRSVEGHRRQRREERSTCGYRDTEMRKEPAWGDQKGTQTRRWREVGRQREERER